MKKLYLILIRLYQSLISPGLNNLLSPGFACRYHPTCSEYSYQAVSKYGILQGSLLAIKRLLRCRPGSPGSYDPVI